ncbi:MAG: hypothetical protein GY913_28680, partial [Proteobacteria bacterium]|nr:hypothetical protein [Pseudomonadota bacterium]
EADDLTRLGHLAWYEGSPVLAVHHLDEESIQVTNYDGQLTGAEVPIYLPDGRVAFVGHLGSEPMPYPQYGRGEGGRSALAVYTDEEFSWGPPADRITGLVASEGGLLAYVATHGEQQRVEVFDGDQTFLGELHDAVDALTLDFLGEEPIYVVSGEDAQLVIGDSAGPGADAIYQLRIMAGGERAMYGFSRGEQSWLMVGDAELGPFGSVWETHEFPELELLAFVANNEDWTEAELVVVSTREGE